MTQHDQLNTRLESLNVNLGSYLARARGVEGGDTAARLAIAFAEGKLEVKERIELEHGWSIEPADKFAGAQAIAVNGPGIGFVAYGPAEPVSVIIGGPSDNGWGAGPLSEVVAPITDARPVDDSQVSLREMAQAYRKSIGLEGPVPEPEWVQLRKKSTEK